jgi:hypothetical protein
MTGYFVWGRSELQIEKLPPADRLGLKERWEVSSGEYL